NSLHSSRRHKSLFAHIQFDSCVRRAPLFFLGDDAHHMVLGPHHQLTAPDLRPPALSTPINPESGALARICERLLRRPVEFPRRLVAPPLAQPPPRGGVAPRRSLQHFTRYKRRRIDGI